MKRTSIAVDRGLLARLLRDYPFQPATAIWRAVEIQALLDHGLPEGRGLDLGCGDGLLTRILLERAGPRELVGVEPDPAEAGLAVRLGIYTAVHVASGAHVPEPDASFDWVLSNSVLEHVDDLAPVLAEAARVLRPGGVFLFTVPAAGFRPALRGPLRPGASRDAYLEALDRRLLHLRYWPDEGWPPLPRELELREEVGYLAGGQARRWETVSRFTAGVLYALGRGHRRPIEIQRGLGLRRGARIPGWLAAFVARVLAAGLSASGQDTCALVTLERHGGRS